MLLVVCDMQSENCLERPFPPEQLPVLKDHSFLAQRPTVQYKLNRSQETTSHTREHIYLAEGVVFKGKVQLHTYLYSLIVLYLFFYVRNGKNWSYCISDPL